MNKIKQLSDREHILNRPNMYIGAITSTKFTDFILEDNKIQYKEVEYNPGLIKIINEIIDNSVDVAIKTNFKYANQIEVNIDDEKVTVKDNGTGIPVTKNSEGIYLPRLCWNHARAGSNFDDTNRTQIGMNGIGSYATACFSKKFIGHTDDGKNAYKITITDNASKYTERLLKSHSQGTIVTFYPDLERFKLTKIDEIHKNIIKQRLINLSISFPEITFKFNKKKINTKKFKDYVKLFSDNFEIYESENIKFAILPNNTDNFLQFSYVNGLKITDGGVHIDVITNNIVNILRDKLSKKYKTIKPGDIKNKLLVIVFIRNFPNPKFNSQTKEKLTNSIKEFNAFTGPIDYSKIALKILKNTDMINNITELYKIKEELAKRKLLKKADKKVKPKSEKFMPPIGNWDRLFICEGDSALGSISKLLGRKNQGFFSMFGVPPNAYSASINDILKSKKLDDLKNIIGLKYSELSQDINFKEIIITADYDLPGHFITGQLLGLFYRFGKHLFEEKRIKRLRTPLVVVMDKDENILKWFYTFDEYREFEQTNKQKNLKYYYTKGLGSISSEMMETFLKHDGLENMLETYELDENSENIIESWLGKDAQKRRDLLEHVSFDIMTI